MFSSCRFCRLGALGLGLVFGLQLMGAPGVAPDPKDPQYQAKGDVHRTYKFPDTGESMPYRIYVPSKWTPAAKLPLMVILHSGPSEDVPFERGDGALTKVAEAHSYIILS